MKSKKWIISIIIVIVLIFAYCIHRQNSAGLVMVTSVSSDGNYAITTDLSRKAILWNLKGHTKKILDHKANIYSAYFIKNSNNFMWQHDSNNEVMVENTSGKVIKKFNPGFPTYGQVMSTDLRNYVAGDEDWQLYLMNNNQIQKIKLDKGGFLGGQKLQNIALTSDGQYFITSGLGSDKEYEKRHPLAKGPNSLTGNYDPTQKVSFHEEPILWDIATGHPIRNYLGNDGKTFATISPDGKYIVAGDEDTWGYVWQANSAEKLFQLWPIWSGKPLGKNLKTGLYEYDASQLKIMPPKDFRQSDGMKLSDIFSLKFIDQTHYLRFTTYVPNYAILYSITNPKPLKYLPLGNYPKISVDDYTRDQSIDTSPQAHVLVTGKINQGGILVYKYDPTTQVLTKVWNSGSYLMGGLTSFGVNFAEGFQTAFGFFVAFSAFTLGLLPFFLYLVAGVFIVCAAPKYKGIILLFVVLISLAGTFSSGFYSHEGMEGIQADGQVFLMIAMALGLGIPYLISLYKNQKK